MSNIEMIQKLLKDKADLQAKINISSFDGSIEIKVVNNEKYIYVRKRVAGKYTEGQRTVPLSFCRKILLKNLDGNSAFRDKK